jgi:Tfp pilus assembly protein PilO
MNLGGYQRLRLVYQKPEIRVSVEIILSVFASLFLIMTAIRPTLVTVAELKKKIEDQSLVEKKLDTKIKSLIQARKQLDEYGDNLPLFEKAVPEGYTYGNLGKEIEILAVEEGVGIESLVFSAVAAPDDEKKDSGLKDFTVRFSVTGSEFAIMGFLEKVENLDRVLLVSMVEITKVKERDVIEERLRTSGEIKGYYL